MVTISKPLSAGQAQAYHANEFTSAEQNYYTQGNQIRGEWQGRLAESWNLRGEVSEEAFSRLAAGQHPETGEQLVRYQQAREYTNDAGEVVKTMEHRAGWDATFSAPKSVSLTALVGGDERIREAHREAVRTALDEMEHYTQARIGGNAPAETTGQWAVAKFEHDSARPVDGYAPPQLHTHAVFFNVTETEDGKAHAVQPQELYRSQQYGTAVYQSELAWRLKELGYEIEAGKNGAPEIRGYSQEYLEASSPRSQQIKEHLAEQGVDGAGAAQIAAHRTRDAKLSLSPDEMIARHRDMAEAFGNQPERIVEVVKEKMHVIDHDHDARLRPAQSAVTFARDRNLEREAVVDERALMRDALKRSMGQAAGVTEAPGVANYQTVYTYDPVDDLRGVTQNGNGGVTPRIRTFTYDQVKRLKTATNPESGLTSYLYDAGGNLSSKTDGRSITTTQKYDALNRVIRKSYSDSGGTPTVSLCYDGNISAVSFDAGVTVNCTGSTALASSVHPVGQLTWETNGNSTTGMTQFDPLSRVLGETQTTGGTSYPFSYLYNLVGGVLTESHPGGQTISTAYDIAGQPTGVTAGATTYASGASYASHGPLHQVTLGNNLTEAWSFDPMRLQPTEIKTGSLLDLHYYYCPMGGTDCGTNNGNVQSAAINATGAGGVNLTQTYQYTDGLNRLTNATESGSAWAQTYSYDAFGNRAVTGTQGTSAWTESVVWSATALTQFDANNRLNRGTGDQYDGAGNQTGVASSAQAPNMVANAMSYDAESRMTGSNIGNMGNVTYLYDGEGRRVQKTAGTSVTTFVYNASGELTEEFSNQASTTSGIEFVSADALGSTRMVTDVSGAVVRLYDYYPFGGDLAAGVGGRGTLYPSGVYPAMPDVEPMKFTGKERDAETGLDYFGARYFSSAQGRWTSPDWSSTPQAVPYADLTDPQTLNLYSYVRNNPLSHRDADGHCCDVLTDLGETLEKTQIPFLANAGAILVGASVVIATATNPDVQRAVKETAQSIATARGGLVCGELFCEGSAPFMSSASNHGGPKGEGTGVSPEIRVCQEISRTS